MAIESGQLAAGLTMPSTRRLAASLGISRGVVIHSYERLIAQGYLVGHKGAGTRVADTHQVGAYPDSSEETVSSWPDFDFRAGLPALDLFPRVQWASALQRTVKSAGNTALGYPFLAGPLAARSELASYLGRSRATLGRSGQVILCAGFTQGIQLTARMLKQRGVLRVALEDPCLPSLPELFTAIGLSVDRVRVDNHGLDVDALERSNATAVVVTPFHQFPTGIRLSSQRRAKLLRWASRGSNLVIEDDYDSDYHYGTRPASALQGELPDRVIYIGTASKTLSPALRLGWMLVPPSAVAELVAAKRESDRGSPSLDQLAFADFVKRGNFEKHLRLTRTVYAARRGAMLREVHAHLPFAEVLGEAAGLHIMITLPDDIDEGKLVVEARNRSISVFGAARYWSKPAEHQPSLLLGYAGVDESRIGDGLRRLADVVRQLRQSAQKV